MRLEVLLLAFVLFLLLTSRPTVPFAHAETRIDDRPLRFDEGHRGICHFAVTAQLVSYDGLEMDLDRLDCIKQE